MNNLKLNKGTIAIGLILLVVAAFVLPGPLGSDDDNNDDNDDILAQERDLGGVDLGDPVTAIDIDQDGCPIGQTSVFSPGDSVYVIAPGSDVEAGASVFVRLYHEGDPVEDAPEITANQEYNNTCINFVFEPSDSGVVLESGSYEAEFIVNGNSAESVQFEVE
jgi:hypothetical protein